MGNGLRRVGVLAALGSLAVLGACHTPPLLDAQSQQRVDALLAGADTKGDLVVRLGAVPTHCIPSSSTTELCQWHLGNATAAWESLAEAIDTSDRVNLICALPLDASPRAPGSCELYPCRTNRAYWKSGDAPTRSSGRGKGSAAARAPGREPDVAAGAVSEEGLRLRAQRELDAAPDLEALSRLVGSLPEDCYAAGPDESICLWNVDGHDYGHGTLATAAGISRRKALVMRCRLAADGSPRASEDCQVEEEGR